MFNWLKGRKPAEPQRQARPPARAAAPQKPAPARRASATPGPLPLPEVVAEGNTQADWSAWEDSMTALDSQMQGLVPSQRIYVREAQPSQLDEADAFASVRARRDR